jgi:hypothetical protein
VTWQTAGSPFAHFLKFMITFGHPSLWIWLMLIVGHIYWWVDSDAITLSAHVYLLAFFLHSRANKTKILEFLRDVWTKDRRAEWSIWMVYSKVEMPHHYMSSGSDDSSHHGHRRVSSLLNVNALFFYSVHFLSIDC